MEISREELLMKLGAARDHSRSAWRLVIIEVAADSATFSYRLDRNKLRQARSREGRYLIRHQPRRGRPGQAVEQLSVVGRSRGGVQEPKGRPRDPASFSSAFDARIEAHVFIAFLAYCLHVTLARACMRWRRG